MSKPDPDQLVAYLYGEAESSASREIDRQIGSCRETRSKVDELRATMAMLDRWQVDPPPVRQPSRKIVSFALPVLKAAAAVAVLLGLGVLLGRHADLRQSDSGAPLQATALAEKDRQIAELRRDKAHLLETRKELEENLVLASGAMTHQQIQRHVEGALANLRNRDARNETLALLLPETERRRYHEKRQAIEELARDVTAETERTQRILRQIMDRTKARSRSGIH